MRNEESVTKYVWYNADGSLAVSETPPSSHEAETLAVGKVYPIGQPMKEMTKWEAPVGKLFKITLTREEVPYRDAVA